MNLTFVTGSDAAFFNSLLICLQSFAERMPGRHLLVCDFGFTPAQAAFLRGLGILLERPSDVAGGAFHCKAALLSYLLHNGHGAGGDDVVVWLDADLALMEISPADFSSVAAAMASADAGIAVCLELLGRTVGQVLATMPDAMAPSARAVAAAAVDPGLPYVSSGLFFCSSVVALQHWREMTRGVAYSPLFEQNMLNVVLHRDRIKFLPLDCEEWQAQGSSLDRVRLVAAARGGRPAACIGGKNIKTLHATSELQGHLLIAPCRMTVRDVDLVGPYKLFLPEPLRMHQLQLLASFIAQHGEALARLGVATPAARPVSGFEFVTL